MYIRPANIINKQYFGVSSIFNKLKRYESFFFLLKFWAFLFFLLFLWELFIISRLPMGISADDASVVGVYIEEHDSYKDTLKINPDHTYWRTFEGANGMIWENQNIWRTGSWEINDWWVWTGWGSSSFIELKEFVSLEIISNLGKPVSEYAPPFPGFVWQANIYKDFWTGEIKICKRVGFSECFVKKINLP